MSNLEISRAERLDQYVVRHVPDISRASAAKLIDSGEVLVNGAVQKAGYKVRPADQIKINYEPDKMLQVPAIDLPVLYEDDDCVVINKPRGVLAHSKGAFNPEPTVASWLRAHMGEARQSGHPLALNERTGIVHRLDRATSGVMICAKTAEALAWLQKQFSQRRVKKTYTAVVAGELKPPQAVIDMPIERNPKRPQTFRVGSNGKPAQTAYRVLQTNGACSLVELQPVTGRTHQLRVHMEKLGHPIIGDELYGKTAAERLFLHAQSLEITLPNRQRKTFSVAVPPEFKEMANNG